MRFLDPGQASYLLALPLAASLWLLYVLSKRRFRRRAGFGPVLRGLSRLSGRGGDGLSLAALLLALAAIGVALMRPQLLIERRLPEYERQDLVLLLDRSASMGAQDVPPTRFRRAILEVKNFLREKPEEIDRVGLVGFAGTSLILSHLTRDLDSLFFYLDWIQEDSELHFGTDIGAALASGRELMRKDARPSRKLFLLISDGDDQGQQLARQLAELRDARVKVHCIGVGGEREAPIPVAGADGAVEFLQDEQGALLTTRFDEGGLRDIAAATGGRYFRSRTGQELAAAMQAVARHERRLIGYRSATEYRDVHKLALLAAAGATLLVLLKL